MAGLETDYLVVGAGAMGMAFTDALIDHADVHVTLVDSRHAPGGHWQDAYPFVQLHQASVFYGVASTVLGTGAVQQDGPEAGLQERARRSEILAYFDDILYRRFIGSGQVRFLGGNEYHTDGSSHFVTSAVSGRTVNVDVRRRVVDATYLSPTIPATTAPPFAVGDGTQVVTVNELASLVDVPSMFVIAGFREDRHRLDRVAAPKRRRSGPRHVGPTPRALDAQPCCRPTRSGRGAGVGCGHDGGSRRSRVTR